MYARARQIYTDALDDLRAQGLFKDERVIVTPQGARVGVVVPSGGRREVLNFCSNNYLGLSDHPAVVAAAHRTLDSHGHGLSSVRFICGTQDIHKELEAKIAAFVGMEDAILYGSAFDANGGLFETLLGEEDAVISDALNHASIIDGIRLCKAERHRYPNGDLDALERALQATQGKRLRLVATDGVFSMDGYLARLDAMADLCDRYDAMLMVDDSHATGFVGPTGRGTPEHFGVTARVDIVTGTFGKALGGASGGFTAARREIVSLLRQRSRPYLFSNTVAPAIVGAAIAALDLLTGSTTLRDKVMRNAVRFREGMNAAGFSLKPGIHPIVPVMLGDAVLAQRMAASLLEEGIYVVGFSYPVVPRGEARIRVQLSAVHEPEDIDRAIDAFVRVGRALGVLKA
jgi:glycine C-acetyltransferase